MGESLPTRGAWIEIFRTERGKNGGRSLPTRGAWIEISFASSPREEDGVAPHAGSVD